MAKKMTTGEFRLNPDLINERAKGLRLANSHQISLSAGVSHPTIAKWLEEPDEVKYLHLRSLAGILVDALRMTPEEALDLRLGDLFSYVSLNDGAGK